MVDQQVNPVRVGAVGMPVGQTGDRQADQPTAVNNLDDRLTDVDNPPPVGRHRGRVEDQADWFHAVRAGRPSRARRSAQ